MTPIRITYTLTEQDFADAHQARRSAEPAQRWSLHILYALVFLLAVAGAAFYVVEPTKETLAKVVPLFIFALLWVAVVRVLPGRFARRAYSRHSSAQAEQVTEFSEQGISTKGTGGSESRIAWTQVLKWAEGKRVFLLYLNPQLFVVYPKRAFGETDLIVVRELMQRRVGAR